MFKEHTSIESPHWLWLCGAIALISGGVFVSQVMFSVLFGILFSFDFRFFSVSLALFGLGIGGIVAALLSDKFRMTASRQILVVGVLYMTTAVLPFLATQTIHHVGVPVRFSLMIIITILSFVNYCFAGMLISSLLARGRQNVPVLYAFDLLGATIFGIAPIILMDMFGFPSAVLLLYVMGCASFACCWLYFQTPVRPLVVAGVAVVMVVIGVFSFSFNIVCSEEATQSLAEKSNSFSFVRLHERERSADFSDVVVKINCNIYTQSFLTNRIETVRSKLDDLRFLPFRLGTPKDVLVVGSGAGVDVERALLAGAEKVTAVEINPLIPKLVNDFRPDMSTFPYQKPESYDCHWRWPLLHCRKQ
jgi:hypothetical protein